MQNVYTLGHEKCPFFLFLGRPEHVEEEEADIILVEDEDEMEAADIRLSGKCSWDVCAYTQVCLRYLEKFN